MEKYNEGTYEEWLADYQALQVEGEKLWATTGLANNIREGWLTASKNQQLFACGLYSVPLETAEEIVRKAEQIVGKPHDVKLQVAQLEEDVKVMQKQIDKLWGIILSSREEIDFLKRMMVKGKGLGGNKMPSEIEVDD